MKHKHKIIVKIREFNVKYFGFVFKLKILLLAIIIKAEIQIVKVVRVAERGSVINREFGVEKEIKGWYNILIDKKEININDKVLFVQYWYLVKRRGAIIRVEIIIANIFFFY